MSTTETNVTLPTVTIDKPNAGWSYLTIMDGHGTKFSGKLSYIQDIYSMFVHAFDVYMNEGVDVAIPINEEGTEFTIVLTAVCIDIIEDRSDKTTITRLWIDATAFIKLCLHEFEKNKTEWITFSYMDKSDYAHYNEDITFIDTMIDRINKRLAAKDRIWARIAATFSNKETNDNAE